MFLSIFDSGITFSIIHSFARFGKNNRRKIKKTAINFAVLPDDNGFRILFPRVILMDAVVEQRSGKVIDLMLKTDGRIAAGAYTDHFVAAADHIRSR